MIWEDNPNFSIDEIEMEDRIEDLLRKKPKNSKVIVIKSNSLQLKDEKVHYLFDFSFNYHFIWFSSFLLIFIIKKSLWWPFGIKLMASLTNLLFFPGFSINSDIKFDEIDVKTQSSSLPGYPLPLNEKILWYPFQSSSFTSKPTKFLIENR